MNTAITIVMYHYVRDLAGSEYPDIKGLDIQGFRRQLDFLSREFNMVTTEEVIAAYAGEYELPPKAALLTFDDGYSDHYEFVLPELVKRKLTGAFFVPVKTVVDHEVLDVNKIHFILAATPDPTTLLSWLKERVTEYDEMFELYGKPSRFDPAEIVFIKGLLQKGLPLERRTKLASELFERCVGRDLQEFSRELYMNEAQLKEMLAAGMHIGSHGYHHYWWNKLSESEQVFEMDESISFLKSLGVPEHNLTVCYPYGAYNDTTLELAKAKGVKLGFTTVVEEADIQQHACLELPRLNTNDFPQ